MRYHTLEEIPILDKYVTANNREPEILKELREHTKENVPLAFMLSDPVTVQLNKLLLRLVNAKKCLEVGTFTGYNALSVALTIPEDGKVYALDLNEDFVKHSYAFFDKANVRHKLNVKIGPAIESMENMLKEEEHPESFDFAYVDAHKPEYKDYVDLSYKLLRKGGIIVLDNMLQEGRVANLGQEMKQKYRDCAEALDKLNQELKNDTRFEVSLLNIDDGVTILYKL